LVSWAGDEAESGVDAGGPGDVGVRDGLTSPLAIDFPVSSALFKTFAARFMKPTVSAMAVADTRPARS
jgi:hypothetical protein